MDFRQSFRSNYCKEGTTLKGNAASIVEKCGNKSGYPRGVRKPMPLAQALTAWPLP